MPSTHLSLHDHVVFRTTNRANSMATAWRERLHAYLGGVVRSVEGVPEAIGGVADVVKYVHDGYCVKIGVIIGLLGK